MTIEKTPAYIYSGIYNYMYVEETEQSDVG